MVFNLKKNYLDKKKPFKPFIYLVSIKYFFSLNVTALNCLKYCNKIFPTCFNN